MDGFELFEIYPMDGVVIQYVTIMQISPATLVVWTPTSLGAVGTCYCTK